jgi:hypothetical protein
MTKQIQLLLRDRDDVGPTDRRQPRNAAKSTGPKSAQGNERSRRNALRHGLTAETVINTLEDAEEYKAFEEAIAADFDAQSAVERELVLRLAGLLGRLRTASYDAHRSRFIRYPSDISQRSRGTPGGATPNHARDLRPAHNAVRAAIVFRCRGRRDMADDDLGTFCSRKSVC